MLGRRKRAVHVPLAGAAKGHAWERARVFGWLRRDAAGCKWRRLDAVVLGGLRWLAPRKRCRLDLRINIESEQAMEAVVLDIKHWGNNLGVRLPAAIARAAHLRADQRVSIVVENGRVVVTPIEDKPLTLEQRLARFDPQSHGGETMVAGDRVGAERW